MHKSAKIYVAGHKGMVGSTIMKALSEQGYSNLIFRTSKELDLRKQKHVEQFFENEKPEYVFLVPGKVGGIQANNLFKADFLYDNLMIQTNVIHSAYLAGVKKLLFLGSSCIYPKLSVQPISEDQLLTGPLEPTNDAYALGKITGIKMCDSYRAQCGCNFISAMPTNLYGPNDNYDLETSHVLPALLRKCIEARRENVPEVVIWGSGAPQREFMHVVDLAEACLFLMNNYNEVGHVNVGTGEDISILQLAEKIKSAIGYQGKFKHDLSKPDGTPRKLLDVSKLNNLGWCAKISLDEGIKMTYEEVKHHWL